VVEGKAAAARVAHGLARVGESNLDRTVKPVPVNHGVHETPGYTVNPYGMSMFFILACSVLFFSFFSLFCMYDIYFYYCTLLL